MKTIIVGPSHVRRLEHAFKQGRLLPYNKNIVFLSKAGAPIWNKHLLELLEKHYSKGDQIIYFVPDFRFGNNILLNKFNSDLFIDNYTHIDRSLISLENDILLIYKCIQAINYFISVYNNDFCLFFYDLFFRDIYNSCSDIKNRGQLLNYAKIENIYTNSCFQIEKDFNLPYYNLLCDSSLHPSNLGYLSLYHMLFNQRPKRKNLSVAYYAAKEYLSKLIITDINFFKLSNICFMGNSVFLSSLQDDVCTPNSLNELRKANIIFVDSDKNNSINDKISLIIYFTDESLTYTDFIKRKILLSNLFNKKTVLLPYRFLFNHQISLESSKDSNYYKIINNLKLNKDFLDVNNIHIGEGLFPYPYFYKIFFSWIRSFIN